MRNGPSSNRIALGRYPIRGKLGVILDCSWKRSCGSSAPEHVAHWARTNGATMGNCELPDEFGKWNPVFKRFRGWVKADTFHSMFRKLASDADLEYAMVDSTIFKAHRSPSRGLKAIACQATGQAHDLRETAALISRAFAGRQGFRC